MVNTLLEDNTQMRGRKLKIRTFKVVPLSPKAGVLQWVDGKLKYFVKIFFKTCIFLLIIHIILGTTPIGQYLVGASKQYHLSAHFRYHPRELTHPECRKKLDDIIVKRDDSHDDRFSMI